jgi:ABC-type Na+ efflux pump permease subunit
MLPVKTANSGAILRALVWKDYRLMRGPIRLSVIASLLIYGTLYLGCRYFPTLENEPARVVAALAGGSISALLALVLAAAVVAGSALTTERLDRSAEFLAYLPPTRFQVLLGKLVVVLGFVLVQLVVHLACLAGAMQLESQAILPPGFRVNAVGHLGVAAAVLCTAGVAWGVSAVAESQAAPVLAGLLAPGAAGLAVTIGRRLGGMQPDAGLSATLFMLFSLALGLAGLFAGCYVFLSGKSTLAAVLGLRAVRLPEN